MDTALIACPKCSMPLDMALFNLPEAAPCPGCASMLQVQVFPAFFRPVPVVATGDVVVEEGEASCFFHPQKRAVTPCESCGRFVCALCDVELKGQHLCPDCLEKGVRKKKLHGLESRRYLYDTLAIQLAVLPIVIAPLWFFTCLTAPAALYVTVRYWKEPLGLMRRHRWRFLVAAVFALAQIAGWVFLIATLVAEA